MFSKRHVLVWLALGLLVLALGGCGDPARWSPTDPRTTPPDTSNTTIVDSRTIGIGTTVTAAAFWR